MENDEIYIINDNGVCFRVFIKNEFGLYAYIYKSTMYVCEKFPFHIQRIEEYWTTDEMAGTMLLKLEDEKYMFICRNIQVFTSTSPIVKFFDPNDSPSYALNKNGNYLLLHDHIKILRCPDWAKGSVYDYYYDTSSPHRQYSHQKFFTSHLSLRHYNNKDWLKYNFERFEMKTISEYVNFDIANVLAICSIKLLPVKGFKSQLKKLPIEMMRLIGKMIYITPNTDDYVESDEHVFDFGSDVDDEMLYDVD